MEKADKKRPTIEETQRFLAEIQAKRPDKPLDGREERFLMGIFSVSHEEGISVQEAVKRSMEETERSLAAQKAEYANDKPYLDTIDQDLKFYTQMAQLLDTE